MKLIGNNMENVHCIDRKDLMAVLKTWLKFYKIFIPWFRAHEKILTYREMVCSYVWATLSSLS